MLFVAHTQGPLIAATFAANQEAIDRVLERVSTKVSRHLVPSGPGLDQPYRELLEYLAGQRRAFSIDLDLALATPFQIRVLHQLQRTPYGQRTTYADLALDLGQPNAARAVGTALGANPLCIFIPCHRVVARSGELAGYAGGLSAKAQLLNLETAPCQDEGN